MGSAQKAIALTDLPLELLWMVTARLSPVDIACLALCNRHLMLSLKECILHYFSHDRMVELGDEARVDLSSRLFFDLLQYHHCYICLQL